jgi:hypothetical protein
MAYGSIVPAYFDTFADTFNNLIFPTDNYDPTCSNPADERRRVRQLREARDMFMHASFALWSGRNNSDLDLAWCVGCFRHLNPGLGELDREVSRETKDVRTAVRDLVEVQRDINTQLENTVEQRTGATAVVAASLGRPFAGSTFPYHIEVGAPLIPPGWREVSGALSSSRAALNPMSHAAMGSRGFRFVMSGTFHDPRGGYSSYRPYRVMTTVAMVQRVLNRRWGANTFKLNFSQGLLATWMERGSNAQEADGAEGDDNEDFAAWVDELFGPPVPPETGSVEPPAQTPRQYDPQLAWRMTPQREIGVEYASSKTTGRIYLTYNGPCGRHRRKVDLFAYSRVHADDGTRYTESQHSWKEGKKAQGERTADGARNYYINSGEVLHGTLRGSDGYESAGHVPSRMCHPWHRHPGELEDESHSPGPEIDQLGIMPGGFGFLFPQDGPDPDTGAARDGAAGAFGQPKLPVLITRANAGPGVTKDPWNLTFRFPFSPSGSGSGIDLQKAASDQPMAALGTGMAYYHRRCTTWRKDNLANQNPPLGLPFPAGCVSWQEPPNLLNPFWHATLVPIDVDEKRVRPGNAASGDATPGARRINEARRMLAASSLDPAAETVRLLERAGYEGIQ